MKGSVGISGASALAARAERREWEHKSGGFKTPWRTFHAGGTIARERATTELIANELMAAFARRGFKPNKLKVIEVRREGAPPNERGAFYLNIGYLRGLDPDEVWRLLHAASLNRKGKMSPRFPDQCGQRKVFEALARLEQRIERPPALMLAEETARRAA
jgi:hypothetical protein